MRASGRKTMSSGGVPTTTVVLVVLALSACTGLSIEPAPAPEPVSDDPMETVCGNLYAAAFDLARIEDRPEANALGEIVFEYIEEWCE